MSSILFNLTNGFVPVRHGKESAGVDLSAPESITVKARGVLKLDLGVRVNLPDGHYGRLALRSSIAVKGLILSGGVIDRDYTGPLSAILINPTDVPVEISRGDRIIQLICEKCSFPELVEVSLKEWTEVTKNSLRNKGFGSTGV